MVVVDMNAGGYIKGIKLIFVLAYGANVRQHYELFDGLCACVIILIFTIR